MAANEVKSAENRTNMVSLIDIGMWLGGTTSNIIEIGDGVTELSEDWGPDVESKQYINMSAKASNLKGYEFSTSVEREYMNDDFQKAINDGFKQLPIGKNAGTYYYRYFKTDITGGTGACIRVPVIMAPSSVGGSGEDVLTSSLDISGNGEVELGTITISENGYTWTKDETAGTTETTD